MANKSDFFANNMSDSKDFINSNVSFENILKDILDKNEAFKSLVSNVLDFPNPLTVASPLGSRPAIAAAISKSSPVVLITPSGRDASDAVSSIRDWYDGDPQDIAELEAWETLPHERLSPRADTVASRMSVFRRLKHPQSGKNRMFSPIRVLVMPVRSIIQPVVENISDVEPLVFECGKEVPIDSAVKRLVENSYNRVELVMNRGEFAVRGGIIDVFSPTMNHPVRIEFFGDEIDTIKQFHASDQRTYGENINSIWATACRELQLTKDIQNRAKSLIGKIQNADDMLESISNAIPVEGMESLLPALVDKMEPVENLLPKNSIILISDPEKCRRAAQDLSRTANEFLAASWHVAVSYTHLTLPTTPYV